MAGTANAVNGPEAAPYLAKAGGTMTGALTLNSSSPASDLIAASKGYVDAVAQGRVFKDPCPAASTGALTVTYNNGSSGVGATLTNAGAMAAFSIDGYSAAVNDRILIKDQASSFQNGIYTVTTVGSGAANWVLTRSTDMDLASEFKGATTFIISGTVNAGRTYTETATVVTIGTDAVTFTQTGDSTAGTVTDVSVVTANNFSGSVATSTTTPAITINANAAQFGAAPSAVANVTGDGTAYTIILNNADLNTGTILNTGTGVWTIPVAGLYQLSGAIALDQIGAAHTALTLNMSGATSSVSGNIISLNPAVIANGTSIILPFSYTFYSTAAATNSLVLTISGSTKTVDIANTTYAGLSLLR